MKEYRTQNESLIVQAYEEECKYYLHMYYKRVAVMHINGKVVGEPYISESVKEFSTSTHANNYFKAIKRNNPTLHRMK